MLHPYKLLSLHKIQTYKEVRYYINLEINNQTFLQIVDKLPIKLDMWIYFPLKTIFIIRLNSLVMTLQMIKISLMQKMIKILQQQLILVLILMIINAILKLILMEVIIVVVHQENRFEVDALGLVGLIIVPILMFFILLGGIYFCLKQKIKKAEYIVVNH